MDKSVVAAKHVFRFELCRLFIASYPFLALEFSDQNQTRPMFIHHVYPFKLKKNLFNQKTWLKFLNKFLFLK